MSKYKHPHFLSLTSCIIIIVLYAMIFLTSCATTAQLYISPRYKIQPDRAYPELQIGMKINIGPKIIFTKKNNL